MNDLARKQAAMRVRQIVRQIEESPRKYRTHPTETEAWAHINQQVDEFYAELRDPEVPR